MSTALNKLDWSVVREVRAKIEEGLEFSSEIDGSKALDDELSQQDSNAYFVWVKRMRSMSTALPT